MSARRSSLSPIQETGGNRHASVTVAQEMALDEVARVVAQVICKGLDSGQLVVVEGRVVIAEDRDEEA
jgi:hypothetical protein